MNGDGGNIVLRTLVDSLANTLTKLLVRQESIEKDIAKIEEAVDSLPEVERVLTDIKAEQKLLKEAIEKIDETIKKVGEISKERHGEILKSIDPVSKLSELMRKPLSVIVALLVLIGAALGLFKLAEDTWDKIHKSSSAPTAVQTNQVNVIP